MINASLLTLPNKEYQSYIGFCIIIVKTQHLQFTSLHVKLMYQIVHSISPSSSVWIITTAYGPTSTVYALT